MNENKSFGLHLYTATSQGLIAQVLKGHTFVGQGHAHGILKHALIC